MTTTGWLSSRSVVVNVRPRRSSIPIAAKKSGETTRKSARGAGAPDAGSNPSTPISNCVVKPPSPPESGTMFVRAACVTPGSARASSSTAR